MKRYLAAATLAAIINTPQAAENWLATWQASPHAAWEASEFALPTGVPAKLERQTVRETARISIGGSRLRVVLSNRYGTQPLAVGEVRVGRAGETMRPLTFGGQVSVVIPPGAPAVSDALEMPVAALEKLAVSVYLPEHTPLATFHWGAQQTGVIVDGNRTADATLRDGKPLHGRALLSGIWVAALPKLRRRWCRRQRRRQQRRGRRQRRRRHRLRAWSPHLATQSLMVMAPRRTRTAAGPTT